MVIKWAPRMSALNPVYRNLLPSLASEMKACKICGVLVFVYFVLIKSKYIITAKTTNIIVVVFIVVAICLYITILNPPIIYYSYFIRNMN